MQYQNTKKLNRSITVEVACALPDREACIELQLEPGTTAVEAIGQSRILDFFDLKTSALNTDHIGIFGKKCLPETELSEGDRVEIYRALLLSPTQARRLRAQTTTEKRVT